MTLTRRGLLSAAACCALPIDLMDRMAFAASPGDKRLVIIMLRGAMDGLHLVQPYGDPAFARLRPGLSSAPDSPEMTPIDDRFALYSPDGQGGIHDLWNAGELSFMQAVSTPYRDGRSHFEGQDILETGGTVAGELRDGWLPRLLSLIPGARMEDALTLSAGAMLLGRGMPSVPNWWPGSALNEDAILMGKLQALYGNDDAFAMAAAEAIRLSGGAGATSEPGAIFERVLARTAADMLNEDVRIAAFSIGGWDTHYNQPKSMSWPIQGLGHALTELKQTLGRNWDSTAVLCVTEFGRGVRENGVGGTDHGTGGLAVLSGGAIRGGQIFGDWPGLGDGDLLDGRDLRPTADIRSYIALLFHQMTGAPLSAIERDVFPGLSVDTKTPLI